MWTTTSDLRRFLDKMAVVHSAWTEDDLTFAEELSEEILQAETHRHFEIAEYTQDYDGTGTPTLPLREWPVTELVSVQLIAVGAYLGGTFPLAAIQVDNERGELVLVTPWGDNTDWPEGNRNIRVTYRAGVGELPKRLVDAARKMTAIQVITTTPNEIEQRGITSIRILSRSESYEGVFKRTLDVFRGDIQRAIDSLKGVLIG